MDLLVYVDDDGKEYYEWCPDEEWEREQREEEIRWGLIDLDPDEREYYEENWKAAHL